VRSIDYSSGYVSPEAGKGSAGVLSIETKMRDDHLRYTATNFIPGVDMHKGLRMGVWSPRVGFSGPLRRGRVWFSNNSDVQYSQLVVPELPKGQDAATSWRGSNLTRIQANLRPGNILYGSFLVNHLNVSNSGLGPLDPFSTTIDRQSRSWFYSLKDQIYLGHGVLFEVGYGENRTLAVQVPQGDGLYLLTSSGREGNYFVYSRQTSERKQLLSNLTLPPLTLLGRHQLKAGIDVDTLEYGQEAHRTGYEQFNAAGLLLWRTTFVGPTNLQITNLEASSYVIDSWSPRKNLRVTYGIRQDWDRLGGQWAFSPRAAVSYAPWTQTRLSAGYAVTRDASSLQLFSQPLDQRTVTIDFAPDGTPIGVPRPGAAYIAAHGRLGNESFANWSLGAEHHFSGHFVLTLNVLRKRGTDGLRYISRGNLFELANSRSDIYDSADIAIHHTLDSRHEWVVSYSRSRTLSNSVTDINADQVLIVRNNYGRMGWDVPDRLLSWGYLPTPLKKWSVAYLLETRDGSPFSVERDGTVVGGVNSRRFPTYFELDLHVEYRLSLMRRRWALRVGCNNITDHNNPTAVNSAIGARDFLKFYGSDGRHLVVRFRTLGKE